MDPEYAGDTLVLCEGMPLRPCGSVPEFEYSYQLIPAGLEEQSLWDWEIQFFGMERWDMCI
jgi:hypothetical protein